MDIATLAEKRAKLVFDLDGEKVTAEYYPHKMTPEYRSRLTRVMDDATEVDEGDARMLSDILISWDVEANGQPFPPTYDNLLRAPQTLVTRAALEILIELGKLAAPPKLKK